MNNTKHILVIKHIVWALLLWFLYILQTVPGLFSLFGAKPVWVVCAAIAIAMFEGEFAGGIYGAVAGLLCDMSGFSLLGRVDNLGGYPIHGFNGLVICLCCVAAGLLVIYLLRCNVFSCLIFVGVTMLLRGTLDDLFSFIMWGHDNAWRLYMSHTLPAVLYTTAVSPLVFLLVRHIYKRFDAKLHQE